jgi:hypothetical protein
MIEISTRLVFLFKTFVIKIPLSRRGYLQGKNEKMLYNKYKHIGILGELKWEFAGVVCMKRYKAAHVLDGYDVRYAKSKIPELKIENCDLYNIANWGVENHRSYLIDYGINEYISTLY